MDAACVIVSAPVHYRMFVLDPHGVSRPSFPFPRLPSPGPRPWLRPPGPTLPGSIAPRCPPSRAEARFTALLQEYRRAQERCPGPGTGSDSDSGSALL